MQDAEPGETFDDLGRRHGGAIVAQRRTRQAALLERLRQAVRHVLGVLRQIPLQVTGEPRAIVDHAKQNRRLPLAARRENFPRSDVAIPMHKAADVLGLVAAHLTIFTAAPRRARRLRSAATSGAGACQDHVP